MTRSYAKRVWHAIWTRPTAFGHTGAVDDEEARAALAAAVRERDAAKASWDASRAHLYRVIRDAAPVLRQADIVRVTGYHRERIRQIVGQQSRSDGAERG
jgi:hypothetical protein